MATSTQKTFNSFSGIDITAVFAGDPIGSLQAISYSINREKAAIYTMGRATPRAFSRGKRMIAGSLVFILFDQNPVINHFSKARFLGDVGEDVYQTGTSNRSSMNGSAADVQLQSGDFEKQVLMKPTYVDQIPPFDVVLSAANEYGERASMRIVGVELMNENSGFSIDDIVVEQQYTYIALDITGWQKDDDTSNGMATVGAKL
ncbi:MAG: hypothetical protein PHY47_00385 [Lachnospiraceae bacterium]|nr:hypothetical protein [Lachnospiraceae bacterium]